MKAWVICVLLPFLGFYLPALYAWTKWEDRHDRKRETDAREEQRH